MKTEITQNKHTPQSLSPREINLLEFVMNDVDTPTFLESNYDIRLNMVILERDSSVKSRTPDMVRISVLTKKETPYLLEWTHTDPSTGEDDCYEKEYEDKSFSKVRRWVNYSKHLYDEQFEKTGTL